MGRPTKPWPPLALGVLEASVDRLKELEVKLKSAQDALVEGNTVAAVAQIADGRVMALEVVDDLVLSRLGKYKQQQQQENPTRWNPPAAVEKETAKTVGQVMSTRRL